jgi:phage gp36-like protein
MPYTSLADLTARYGERLLVALTDRGDVATGAIDTSVVDRALADTDAMIDGYLAGRYALPLAAVPTILTDLAQQIAIWKLHVAAADPKIEADYKDAMRALRDIAAGTITLSVAGVAPAGSGSSGARVAASDALLTAETLKGFI